MHVFLGPTDPCPLATTMSTPSSRRCCPRSGPYKLHFSLSGPIVSVQSSNWKVFFLCQWLPAVSFSKQFESVQWCPTVQSCTNYLGSSICFFHWIGCCHCGSFALHCRLCTDQWVFAIEMVFAIISLPRAQLRHVISLDTIFLEMICLFWFWNRDWSSRRGSFG